MNCQCQQCGHRGERGLDVVIYQAGSGEESERVLLCEDCACVMESDGAEITRLEDQSGELPEWAA